MNAHFPTGKLPAQVLARLLSMVRRTDPRVLIGPGIGLDAAVIDMGDRFLVAKTDPITFAADAIGWYAVHVNANDIATTGGSPRWFLATVLLPADRADEAMASAIVAQIDEACAAIGACAVGGHTEVTHGLDRPVVVGVMLGEVEPGQLVTAAGAKPGDAIVVTKGVAVEGTSLIAREKGETLAHLGRPLLDRCRRFLTDPGISIVRDAKVVTSVTRVHAMHDPTEGGLATGLLELAEASRVGLTIDESAVPFYAETRLLCQELGLDPWGLIASGCLLMAVDGAAAPTVVDELRRQGIEGAIIGTATGSPGELVLVGSGGARPLPRFARDEIAKLFG